MLQMGGEHIFCFGDDDVRMHEGWAEEHCWCEPCDMI